MNIEINICKKCRENSYDITRIHKCEGSVVIPKWVYEEIVKKERMIFKKEKALDKNAKI